MLKDREQLHFLFYSCRDDLKNATDQMLVTATSLATILLKYYQVRSQQAHQLIDRCPLYVSKERPLRSKIFRGSKKVRTNLVSSVDR